MTAWSLGDRTRIRGRSSNGQPFRRALLTQVSLFAGLRSRKPLGGGRPLEIILMSVHSYCSLGVTRYE
jgi:hypothetical protein